MPKFNQVWSNLTGPGRGQFASSNYVKTPKIRVGFVICDGDHDIV